MKMKIEKIEKKRPKQNILLCTHEKLNEWEKKKQNKTEMMRQRLRIWCIDMNLYTNISITTSVFASLPESLWHSNGKRVFFFLLLSLSLSFSIFYFLYVVLHSFWHNVIDVCSLTRQFYFVRVFKHIAAFSLNRFYSFHFSFCVLLLFLLLENEAASHWQQQQ